MNWKGRLGTFNYIKVFVSECYIKIREENMGKFYSRTDEGIFLGYSYDSKSYICYNVKLNKTTMSTNVKVDDEKTHFTNKISKEQNTDRNMKFNKKNKTKGNKKKRKNWRKNKKMNKKRRINKHGRRM
jgi:hypothetical protein